MWTKTGYGSSERDAINKANTKMDNALLMSLEWEEEDKGSQDWEGKWSGRVYWVWSSTLKEDISTEKLSAFLEFMSFNTRKEVLTSKSKPSENT